MASMIYGVSRNERRGIALNSDDESDSEKDDKPNTLQSHFFLLGNKIMLGLKVEPFLNLRLKQNHMLVLIMHSCIDILH